MGRNLTGTPNTNDYNLGRGIIYIAPLHATTGMPLGYRDVGNAPEFTVSAETEVLEHFSSREGLKALDKSVTLTQKMTIGFTVDEVNHENLALFFSGDLAAYTNPAKTGVTEYEFIVGNETSATNLIAGRWYDLVTAAGGRLYDILSGSLVLKTTNGTPVTLALNTDYDLDLTHARVFFKSTSSAVATAIAGFEGVTMTYTASAGSKNVHEVRGLANSGFICALKFISENPANGDAQTEYQFHKVTLKPDGEFSLIGDDWTLQPITGDAEKNTTASPTSPTVTIRNLQPS